MLRFRIKTGREMDEMTDRMWLRVLASEQNWAPTKARLNAIAERIAEKDAEIESWKHHCSNIQTEFDDLLRGGAAVLSEKSTMKARIAELEALVREAMANSSVLQLSTMVPWRKRALSLLHSEGTK